MGNIEDAANWLLSQPAGVERDPAIKALANAKRRKGAMAMRVAAQLSDPAERDLLMRGVFRRWHDGDPAEASKFLDQSKWSEDRLRSLRAIADHGK
jgi:hypothetical protein